MTFDFRVNYNNNGFYKIHDLIYPPVRDGEGSLGVISSYGLENPGSGLVGHIVFIVR